MMNPLPPDASADHSMRDLLRETPCRDCGLAAVHGCMGGVFPSWVIEMVRGVEYHYAITCPQLAAHKSTQQPTQPRPATRRR
jgi:hypothetical protein